MESSSFNTQKTKKKLSDFAQKAKILLWKNTFYRGVISQKKEQIKDSKNLLLTYTQHTIQNKNSASLKTKLISDIANINQKIQKQNFLLIQHKQTLRNKMQRLIEEIQIPNPVKSELSKAKEDYFILYNALLEKNSLIEHISNSIEQFERCILYKENQRDIYIYDQDIINDELDDRLIVMQDTLLQKCKDYNKLITNQNKLNNKIKKLNKFYTYYKYNQLTKQADALIIPNKTNELLSRNAKQQNGICVNVNALTSISSTNNYTNNNNNIFNGSVLSEDSLQNTMNNDKKDETGIFDDLNSDSENEVEFDNVVNQKRYLWNYEELHNKVPKLNLKQIEYNKRKVKPGEVSEISLSRRIEHSSLREQMQSIKFKIKLIKHKIKKKQERLKKYETKINKTNNIMVTMNSMTKNTSNSIETLPTIPEPTTIPNTTSKSCDAFALNEYILNPRRKTQMLEAIKEE